MRLKSIFRLKADVIADYHILGGDGQDKKNMKVILVAAKKTEISSLINLFRKTHIQIRVIDIHAFACFNAFNHAHQNSNKGPSVLLDIGSETCSLLVIADTEPAFMREISLGSLDILETFKKKCGGGYSPKGHGSSKPREFPCGTLPGSCRTPGVPNPFILKLFHAQQSEN